MPHNLKSKSSDDDNDDDEPLFLPRRQNKRKYLQERAHTQLKRNKFVDDEVSVSDSDPEDEEEENDDDSDLKDFIDNDEIVDNDYSYFTHRSITPELYGSRLYNSILNVIKRISQETTNNDKVDDIKVIR